MAARAAGAEKIIAVDTLEHKFEIARKAGATGIIAPATRPERVSALRGIVGPDMVILSPGVGTQGGSAGTTIRAGADAVIVGRSLYLSEDPSAALQALLDDVRP